jgi:NADPH:quinone reductase-like Zn-dependent oxidoreductase
MTMKLAVARPGAGIDALEIREAPIPDPGPGEALVRLTAATLNFRDLLFIKGILPYAKQPDYVPLSCATGEVLAVGQGVTALKPGDRVNPLFYQGIKPGESGSPHMLGGSVDGVARTHGVFPADSLCLVPDELGDLEAATLPCAALTAWTALFGPRPIKAGERILVQGTGGVSMAALQWAKAAGAEVIVTSSSDAKLRRARALGADLCVNYRTTPEWGEAVLMQLGGKGVDIVVDNAGASQLAASASVLNEGGIIAAIGMLDGEFSWGKDIGKTIVPISVGNREQHEAMAAFAARHGIRPVVDVVYDLTRLGEAMRRHESGQFFGKVGVNLL